MNKNIKNLIGPVVRRARESKQPLITQEELALMLCAIGIKISSKRIAAIELQQVRVRDYELLALMRLLSISSSELMTLSLTKDQQQ